MGRTLFLREYASFISDAMITELMDYPRNMMLSIDIIPVAMDEAVSDIRKRIMSVESDITRWQQRQNQNNNFTANIPYDLEQMRSETKEFMDDLMSRVRDLQRKNCEDVLTSQVRNYIYLHIMDKLQVTDIAKEFDVTPNYLSDRFRKQEGISLKQYIINEKIEASEYFLKYTDKSIGEISEHCAFGSQSRFTQYFRERHGVTPSAYRRIFQQEHEI